MSEDKKPFGQKFKDDWAQKSGAERRSFLVKAVIVGVLLLFVLAFALEDPKPAAARRGETAIITDVVAPTRKDLNVQDVANSVTQLRNQLERLQAERKQGGNELSREDIQAMINESMLKEGASASAPDGMGAPDVTDPMPGMGAGAASDVQAPIPGEENFTQNTEPEKPRERFRTFVANSDGSGGSKAVEGSMPAGQGAQDGPKKDSAENSAYIPSGSIFRVVSITGLNAPTSEQAQKTPMPVMFRVRGMTNLPNRYQADLQDCFIQGVGYGQMADERVLIRTSRISCMNKHGQAMEAVMNGTVYGEDGKIGLRGRMVSKTGEVVSNMLKVAAMEVPAHVLVGLASNIEVGKNSAQAPAGSIYINAGKATQESSQAAAASVSNIFNRIAGIYEQHAQQTFPVIEVNPGRYGTVSLITGLKLQVTTEPPKEANR